MDLPSASQPGATQYMQREMEDYLKRIETINKVVTGILTEVKTGEQAEKPAAPPAAPKPEPKERYSADYKRWDKIVTEAEKEEEEEKKQKEFADLEEQVCYEESVRSKEAGNKFFKEGLYKEAHEAYTRAMVLDKDEIVHPLNRALCNIRLENWQQGLQDCEAVLKVEPHHPKALVRKATIFQYTQRFEDALEVWDKVVKMNPRSPDAKDNIPTCKKEILERKTLQQFMEADKEGVYNKLQDVLGRFRAAVDEYLAPAESAPAEAAANVTAQTAEAPLGNREAAKANTAEANGAPDDPEAKRVGAVLACLGMLPALLDSTGSQIYFRVNGGLAAMLRLLRHVTGSPCPPAAAEDREALMATLLLEGVYNALAYCLSNAVNQSAFVAGEKRQVLGKKPTDGTLGHALSCVTEAKKEVAQAALHLLSTAADHEWVRAQLHLQLSAQQVCAFPTHNKSGLTMAFIVKMIDNCLKHEGWAEDFKKVDLLTFLLLFSSSEFVPLRRHIVGCLLRLTTRDHYRARLLDRDGAAFRHIPSLIKVFKADIQYRGSAKVEYTEAVVVEGILSSLVNCMTLDPSVREELCRLLLSKDVVADCIHLVTSHSATAVATPDLPVVCRALNCLAKCVVLEDCARQIVASQALMEQLPVLANAFGLVVGGLPDAAEPEKDTYREGIVEYSSILMGMCTKAGQPQAEDVCALVLPEWTLLAGLLTHPNNNICGNIALTFANLAERGSNATVMGKSKVKVVDLLLGAIKTRRNESFQAALHVKNTEANNQHCQMNCAIALAKLAKDEDCRDQLREQKGMEILHTVLQAKRAKA
uniref:Protein unc-45 homolog B n=1 Tax=Eutreptiella gymnastica TaxID=73025 RepID=A0A7S1HVG8_9EUGL|mmetsp:Transcript_108540/g.187623  ORF Transcript_108540/g.187623 Transcript_108540/m.187623 type:complete len:816 (+) Transcript_108540:41-2488(+)